MSLTTHYGFNKPIGSDLVNPLTDTFPNWDIADSTLFELDERSIANCTEVVSLGVHAISRLNTDTKFLKWIATANFTAGDTFTVDGNVVAAATASGEALATNAYVTGAVILACLNADNSAMTVYLTGTNVASDSAKLGGELPSYYATDADMSNAQNDITNIQNLEGNTSIVGIGDGTLTGAVSALKSALPNQNSEEVTADGVKTYQALILELKALVSDLTKITPLSYIEVTVSGNTKTYRLVEATSTVMNFSCMAIHGSSVDHYFVELNYGYYGENIGGTASDLSSTVAPSGSKIKVVY